MRLLKTKTDLAARGLLITARALENVEDVHGLRTIVQNIETALTLVKMVIYSCEQHLIQNSAHDLAPNECEPLIDRLHVI